jgi:hypothetical protein
MLVVPHDVDRRRDAAHVDRDQTKTLLEAGHDGALGGNELPAGDRAANDAKRNRHHHSDEHQVGDRRRDAAAERDRPQRNRENSGGDVEP